jgi:hypothetical protein
MDPHHDKILGMLTGKTQTTHPYSYDPFIVWQTEIHEGPKKIEPNDSCYSDRLMEWDFKKHNLLRLKHFGNEAQLTWNQDDPSKTEAFLRDYFNKPDLKLIRIIQYCNLASGYPCWRFDFHYQMPKKDAGK